MSDGTTPRDCMRGGRRFGPNIEGESHIAHAEGCEHRPGLVGDNT